ncbi:hypothetical protein [Rhodococcus globerulus]|uniref:hypothetical protein n=1 Tax=Rhodococcus globerulus TaxID=33008 RepID=UPI000AF6A74E|nr:hypothetical protein [Rhodococcus globerulus]
MRTHTEPIPVQRPGPAVWLYGAHGGAGVSTLTHYLSFAGDCERGWPCGNDVENESPYVVIVARETSDGLKAAHELIVDHHENGLASDLLGLITVASSPTLDKSVRQYRDVVTSPGSVSAHWSIGWHKFLAAASRPALPQWHPLDGIPEQTKGAAVPTDVIAAGVGIVTAIQKSLPQLYNR